MEKYIYAAILIIALFVVTIYVLSLSPEPPKNKKRNHRANTSATTESKAINSPAFKDHFEDIFTGDDKGSPDTQDTLQSTDAPAEDAETQSDINCPKCGSNDVAKIKHSRSTMLYVICCLASGVIFSVGFQLTTWGSFAGMVVGGLLATGIERLKRNNYTYYYCENCKHSWKEKIQK